MIFFGTKFKIVNRNEGLLKKIALCFLILNVSYISWSPFLRENFSFFFCLYFEKKKTQASAAMEDPILSA